MEAGSGVKTPAPERAVFGDGFRSQGLSFAALLFQATKPFVPPALLPITGIIPLTQTIFLADYWPKRCPLCRLPAFKVAH